MPFSFSAVPSLTVEWGGAQRFGTWLAALMDQRRALIVTDAGLHRAGVLANAHASLAEAGFTITIFDQVIADPPESIVLACVAHATKAQVDVVIGFGGGSSMDVAKIAALLLCSPQSFTDIYGINKARGKRLPLVQVPTTAGTGSEATNITILTTSAQAKMGIIAPQLYADHVLLDAELSMGLPPLPTAATGIDAMVHAIEAYTSRHKKNLLSDALAREALRLLDANLLTACTQGSNRAARKAMLLGANFAGQAFANSPVAAVHALAYPLGSRYHISHGISNALMLGPVLRFNLNAAAALYAELADVVLGSSQDDITIRAARFVAHLEQRMDHSGAPRRLRDAGVKKEMLPTLAAEAMQQTRLLGNNPIPVTEADALTLYQAAF